MFSIDEDELDIDLDDEEFLLAACGIGSSSINTNSKNRSNVTSKNDSTLQASTGFSRKPFGALENSATLPRGKNICLQSPGNHLNQLKPAGSGRMNNISPTCTKSNNNPSKSHNLKINLPSRKGDKEFEPPAKRCATSSSSTAFVQKHSSNVNDQRISNNYTNIQDINFRNKNSGPLQRLNNSPRSLNNGNKIPHSPGMFSRSNTSLNISSSNSRSQSSSLNLRTPDYNSPSQNRLTPQGRQEINKPGSFDGSVADITPSRKKSSRKFPGPAGLLPKLTIGQNLEELTMKLSPSPSTSRPVSPQQPVSLQTPSEDEEFTRDPWVGMFEEYQQNVPAMMRYSIVKVISEAACQRLRYGKVPSLCVLVKTFSPTETDSSIYLKDPTGEINGTLHKRVLEEYQTELGPGAGIILKQVSVFSPSPRKHYLNITPGNIIHIYPPDPSHLNSSQLLASQGTQAVNPKQRIVSDEPEVILDSLIKTPEKQQKSKENLIENSEKFDELLEGLDDDDILDEDLIAMY